MSLIGCTEETESLEYEYTDYEDNLQKYICTALLIEIRSEEICYKNQLNIVDYEMNCDSFFCGGSICDCEFAAI